MVKDWREEAIRLREEVAQLQSEKNEFRDDLFAARADLQDMTEERNAAVEERDAALAQVIDLEEQVERMKPDCMLMAIRRGDFIVKPLDNSQDCGGECHADCDPYPACGKTNE